MPRGNNVKIISSKLDERQGGVSTYVRALKALLPLYELNVVENNDFDVLLHVGPHFYDGVETSSGKKNVIVVHDIIPELLWGDISVREERCRALRCAHSVIAVSEWTKNDLIREYDVEPEKVHVIHHGPGGVVHDQNICVDRLSVPFKSNSYLLYVGKRNDYKRFKWMICAVAPIMWRHPNLRLLCTGDPFCRREWALIVLLGLFGRVKVRRFENDEMPEVYSRSLALIYPSVYEGFGFPVLEAMSAKCPVIASRSTCIPEVAGEAAAYYLEGDAKDFRRTVMRFVGESEFCQDIRREFIKRGQDRVKLFSWNRCAKLTADILLSQ